MSDYKVPGRAYTIEEKRAIMERILAVWEQYPDMRLGQLLDNSVHSGISVSDRAARLFYMEDKRLVEMVEFFLARHGKE
jgi:hypothetical protein